MHRIDTSTSQKDKFGPGKNGFTGGNPQTGIPATALNAAFFDSVQEEISGVIEAAGIALDPDKNDQLKTAISMIVTGAMPEVPVTSVNTKTGAVVLSATDVGAVAKVNGVAPDGSGNVVINIPAAPVTSVNTKTGAVVLKATDVGAVAKVNNISPDANGNVNITIPSGGITGVRLTNYGITGGDFRDSAHALLTGIYAPSGYDNPTSHEHRQLQYQLSGTWYNAAYV